MNNQTLTTEVFTKKQVREQLLDFICQQFMVERDDIEVEKSLIDTGIIDSIGLIEISSFITSTFKFKVTVDQMTRQNFGSVLLIVDFIEKNRKL